MGLIDTSTWRHEYVESRERWIVGMDIGQSIDPTAICAIHHVVRGAGEFEPDENKQIMRQKRVERFNVRHIERLPLGTSYPVQIQHVANLLAREPLIGADFVLDFTGVGRPVADAFDKAGLKPHKVLITAGNEVTVSGRVHHVPKQFLISTLESRQHSGELKIAPELKEAPTLKEELRDFARSVSEAGRVTFSARSGRHDDIVLSIAIALHIAINRPFVKIEPFPAM